MFSFFFFFFFLVAVYGMVRIGDAPDDVPGRRFESSVPYGREGGFVRTRPDPPLPPPDLDCSRPLFPPGPLYICLPSVNFTAPHLDINLWELFSSWQKRLHYRGSERTCIRSSIFTY